MIYRATYARNGRALGVTFAADSNEEADSFVTLWESCAKVEVLTLKCLGMGTACPDKRPELRLVP